MRLIAQPCAVLQCERQGEGLTDLPRQRDGFQTAIQRLIHFTQMPKGHRQIAAMGDTGILPRDTGPEERAGAVIILGQRQRRLRRRWAA